MANPIFDVLSSVIKPVGDYFNRKQELKAQAHENELKINEAQAERQCQLIREGLTADMNWEMEFARQAGSSWKDDFELVIISVPLVLCFHPKGAQIVHDGFVSLQQTPAWYQLLTITIFLANYGIRYFRRTQSDT